MNSVIIACNIIKRVFKSPKEIVVLVVLPVLLVIGIYSTMAKPGNFDSSPAVGIVDMDGSRGSLWLSSFLGGRGGLKTVELDNEGYKEAVKDRKVGAAVIIPQNFTKELESGRKVQVTIHAPQEWADTARLRQLLNMGISTLYSAYGTGSSIASGSGTDRNEILDEILDKASDPLVSTDFRRVGDTEDKAGGNNEDKTSPIGFSIMFTMVLAFTTIGVILDDKRNLTLARMYVSPVREWEIIAGNLMGSLALGILQIIPLIVTYKLVFEIDSFSQLAGISLILFAFLIATVGLGIGLSGVIKRNFNPVTVIAAVITPTSILGGCFIPPSMLPDMMNRIGYLVPQKWVMDAIGRLLAGEDIQSVLLNMVIILMFGLAFATFGLKTIRPLND